MSHHYIPYGKQTIEEEDIQAVVEVLKENQFLTTGPRVAQFEQAMCDYIESVQNDPEHPYYSSQNQNKGKLQGIAVNSGTAALHAAMRAIQLLPGDEVIVPAISFAATSNCVLYEQGIPVFCDVEEDTLNIDPNKVRTLITPKTRAIIAVDYAGQVANYLDLRKICDEHDLWLIADAAHSIGLRTVKWFPSAPNLAVGTLAHITATSFHPVKNMTTAEGGMCFTSDPDLAKRMRRFRCHGIDVEYNKRVSHAYDITELGYNYRLTDIQCALGISQLRRVPQWIDRRQELAQRYDSAFAFKQNKNLKSNIKSNHLLAKYVEPLMNKFGCAYHIYVVKFHLRYYYSQFRTVKDLARAKSIWNRDVIFNKLKEAGLGVNVHYKPIYLLSFYQNHPQVLTTPGLCPVAEEVYDQMITIPMYPTMTNEEQDYVIEVITKIIETIHESIPNNTFIPICAEEEEFDVEIEKSANRSNKRSKST